MVGRSQIDSLVSAMQDLKSGHEESILVPWEPISRAPGDTTGTIITDLPHHFRTDARNQYLHGTSGYGFPKIRENGLQCSTHGKEFCEDQQVRLFTAKSMWTCLSYAPAVEFKFPSKEDLTFEDEPNSGDLKDVSVRLLKAFKLRLNIPITTRD